MRRFADEEQGRGEIELEPLNSKQRPRDQPVHLAATDVRNGFARKVYGIVGMQLLVTAFIAGCMVHSGQMWLRSNPTLLLGAVTFSCFVSLALGCVFGCNPEVMRRSPLNYGLLMLLTVAEGVLVGFSCLQFTTGSVLLCAGLTSAVVVALSIYAASTKTDITGFGPYLLCFLLALCGTGFLLFVVSAMGLTNNPMFNALQVLYAAGGTLVFSIFIVYDTQLIMGGSHQHEFSVDDYAMAAIMLYLDIIQLFLSLLRLLGDKDDGGL